MVVTRCILSNLAQLLSGQNLVEEELVFSGYFFVAKEYIRYRYKREIARNGIIYEEASSLLNGNNEYWQTENSNKNAQVVTTQRDYLAGILSTDIAKRTLLPSDVVKADEAGEIHEHDKDYLAQKTLVLNRARSPTKLLLRLLVWYFQSV